MGRDWSQQCRRFVLTAIAATLCLWAAAATFNLIYDPLWFLWKAPLFAKRYSRETIYLFAGLPRTHPAQFVIAGQSHSQNFLPADVETIFHLKALNLAMAASTAREDRLALQLALDSGPVERVLWEMSFGVLAGGPQALNQGFVFPAGLYGEGPLTTVRYLSSIEVFDIGVQVVAGDGPRTLDRYGYWGDQARYGCAEVMRSPGAFKPWFDAPLSADESKEIAAARESLAVNVLGTARRHPQVRFDLFLPPASTAAYSGNVRIERALWETILDGASELDNVHVYNFRAWRGVIDDFDLYKDVAHYRPEISRRILEEVAAGNMLLTPSILDDEWTQLLEMLKARPKDCYGG